MTNNQTDIFEMFNLVDEHAEKKEEEAAAIAEAKNKEREAELEKIRFKKSTSSAGNKSKPKSPAKKEDEFTPNEDTVIRYYGESLDINTYFTPEELAEGILVKKKDEEPVRKQLEPEMLRKRMEKDFPELVKAHTDIIFLKSKNIIVPTMKAKKKGCEEGVLSNDSTFPFPTKIPFPILQDFIAVAKLYGEAKLEVHADIYYHKEKEQYFLDIPKQMVHQLWTEVTEESYSIVERVQDAIKVMEIHSHHSMRPIPSSQDNESERVPGMHYAIIGHTDHFLPMVYLRQFISEEVGHVTKLPETFFSSPFDYLPTSLDSDMIEVSTNGY